MKNIALLFLLFSSGAMATPSTPSPYTALGDLLYGGVGARSTRLPGNTTATQKFLCQTGTGSASAAPAWCTSAGGGITDLTGDVTASGTGSVAATVANVGGKTAAAVAQSVTDTVAATNANTVSTIVKRDGSGNFSAGTITAALTGTASGNTTDAGTSTLTNKTLSDTTTKIGLVGFESSKYHVLASQATTARTLTIPDLSSTLALTGGSQTFSSKTIVDSSALADATDTTKKAGWLISGATTGTKTTLSFSQTANRTINFPDNPGTVALSGGSSTVVMYDDFIGGFYGSGIVGSLTTMHAASSGAGAIYQNSAAASTNTNPGVLELTTGTTTSGFSYMDDQNAVKNQVVGGGVIAFETLVKLSAVSDATDTYQVMFGLGTFDSSTTCNDGIYFQYTHGTNSGNWQYITSNASTKTIGNSSVAGSSAAWTKLAFVLNAAASSVQFYINGTAVGSAVVTNIPATTTALKHMWIITKTAGTTSRSLYVDYFKYQIDLTTAR